MSIQYAIAKQILDDTDASTLQDDRVFVGRAPKGLARPHTVITFDGAERPRHLGGSEGLVETALSVTVVANTPATRITLSDAIRNALDNLRDVTKGPVGREVYIRSVRLEGEDDDELQPPDGSDNWVFIRDLTFAVWHDETVPAPT